MLTIALSNEFRILGDVLVIANYEHQNHFTN